VYNASYRSTGHDHAVGQQDTQRHLALVTKPAVISPPPPQHEGAKLHCAAAGDGTEQMSRVPGTPSPNPQPRESASSPTQRVSTGYGGSSARASKPQIGTRMLPNERLVGQDPHRPRQHRSPLWPYHTRRCLVIRRQPTGPKARGERPKRVESVSGAVAPQSTQHRRDRAMHITRTCTVWHPAQGKASQVQENLASGWKCSGCGPAGSRGELVLRGRHCVSIQQRWWERPKGGREGRTSAASQSFSGGAGLLNPTSPPARPPHVHALHATAQR
jgi:hypothetical protein